jgi:hypothetical protein
LPYGCFLAGQALYAQAPQGISYQAISVRFYIATGTYLLLFKTESGKIIGIYQIIKNK